MAPATRGTPPRSARRRAAKRFAGKRTGKPINVVVTRGANGELGIGLNECNVVVELISVEASTSGLLKWDQVVAIDGKGAPHAACGHHLS